MMYMCSKYQYRLSKIEFVDVEEYTPTTYTVLLSASVAAGSGVDLRTHFSSADNYTSTRAVIIVVYVYNKRCSVQLYQIYMYIHVHSTYTVTIDTHHVMYILYLNKLRSFHYLHNH